MPSDLVARWSVPLSDKVHQVEFEHGTTTGKRIVCVDKQIILRRDYMFKLVGKETFTVGSAKCEILIEPRDGFNYSYTLEVNGKRLEKFAENQSRVLRVWHTTVCGLPYRIVLEKDTLDVWVNGEKTDTTGEFVEEGTETHFNVGGGTPAFIKAFSSGKRKLGIIHTLYVNGEEVAAFGE